MSKVKLDDKTLRFMRDIDFQIATETKKLEDLQRVLQGLSVLRVEAVRGFLNQNGLEGQYRLTPDYELEKVEEKVETDSN